MNEWRRVWRFFGRLDLAAGLIFVVLVLAGVGSLFPQLSASVIADPGRFSSWTEGVRTRYGGLADLLAMGGAFRYGSSGIFVASVALLAAVTLVCTLNRWRGVWRRTFRQAADWSDDAPHVAVLALPPASDLIGAARESLERRGFRVRAGDDGGVLQLWGDRNRPASLATLATHLAVLLLLLGVAFSGGWAQREEIVIEPDGTALVELGDGLALHNTGFAILRYPDKSAANYEALLTVFERERVQLRGRVRVNEPLVYNAIKFYLRGYTGTEGAHTITLLAVRDPGYGLVVAAGLLLLFGLTVSFNWPHCRVHVRVEPDGTLRLAGRAARRAWDFGREFAALAAEIECDRV